MIGKTARNDLGHFITRGYYGQTAMKTQKKMDEAKVNMIAQLECFAKHALADEGSDRTLR